MNLSRDELLEKLSIKMSENEAQQFVFGDNIAGYYEGWSRSYNKGDGYVIGKSSVISGHAAYINDKLLDRRDRDCSSVLYPYGFFTTWPDGENEALVLQRGSTAVTLKIKSKDKAMLGFRVVLNYDPSEVSLNNNIISLPVKGDDRWSPSEAVFSSKTPILITKEFTREIDLSNDLNRIGRTNILVETVEPSERLELNIVLGRESEA